MQERGLGKKDRKAIEQLVRRRASTTLHEEAEPDPDLDFNAARFDEASPPTVNTRNAVSPSANNANPLTTSANPNSLSLPSPTGYGPATNVSNVSGTSSTQFNITTSANVEASIPIESRNELPATAPAEPDTMDTQASAQELYKWEAATASRRKTAASRQIQLQHLLRSLSTISAASSTVPIRRRKL